MAVEESQMEEGMDIDFQENEEEKRIEEMRSRQIWDVPSDVEEYFKSFQTGPSTVEPEPEEEELGESNVSVFARWRPLTGEEAERGDVEIERLTTVSNEEEGVHQLEIQGEQPVTKTRKRRRREEKETAGTTLKPFSWSGDGFSGVIDADENNMDCYVKSIEPLVYGVLDGHTGACFAYGHTGSGKTHTLLGYGEEYGMYYLAAQQIFEHLAQINAETNLGACIAVRFAELHNKKLYDLVDERKECFVKEGPDRKVHFRAKVKIEQDGKVYQSGIKEVLCFSAEEVAAAVADGVALRTTGSSTLHDQSSRSHAFLEMTVTTRAIREAKEGIVEADARLTPEGYKKDIMSGTEGMKLKYESFEQDGKTFLKVGIKEGETYDVEGLKAQKALVVELEANVRAAKENCERIKAEAIALHSCVGGVLVFVDLAGSEHGNDQRKDGRKQTPSEKREGKEINMSLMALNNVISARIKGEKRIPFRESRLTMALRNYFTAQQTDCVMMACLSPSVLQAHRAVKTLHYAGVMALNNSR